MPPLRLSLPLPPIRLLFPALPNIDTALVRRLASTLIAVVAVVTAAVATPVPITILSMPVVDARTVKVPIAAKPTRNSSTSPTVVPVSLMVSPAA